MFGSHEDCGIIPRSISVLFQKLQPQSKMTLSMVELYNGEIRDLLADNLELAQEIRLLETASGQTRLEGNVCADVHDAKAALDLIRIGLSRRAKCASAVHEQSSRSHCVATLTIGEAVLHLVDLAGSESADRSGFTAGLRATEAAFVNKSLSALADVLQSLRLKQSHIPYRNSPLTRLISNALGGQAKMLMMVCVSPDHECASETTRVLAFGENARQVAKRVVK